MRIALGVDHRGYAVRPRVLELLERLGHAVDDVGSFTAEAVDYPDVAAAVCQRVARGEADRGILLCGTGLGMCIAANKFHGIRAAPCHDDLTAELSRRYTDANVLCLSAELLGERLIERMIELWLVVPFDGGHHQRRVQKITELERQLDANPEPPGDPSGDQVPRHA